MQSYSGFVRHNNDCLLCITQCVLITVKPRREESHCLQGASKHLFCFVCPRHPDHLAPTGSTFPETFQAQATWPVVGHVGVIFRVRVEACTYFRQLFHLVLNLKGVGKRTFSFSRRQRFHFTVVARVMLFLHWSIFDVFAI